MNDRFDKTYGCWLGKCIGGSAGAAVEGYKKYIDRNFLETMRPDLPNDDLDLQLLWFDVLTEKGLSLRAEDLAEAWKERCWYPFSEYGIFLRNYDRGILPPLSGSFENPLFHDGEGSPIRSEIWATVFPGKPEKAAWYAKMDSSLDHSGDASDIEAFYAAAESMAFERVDIRGILMEASAYLACGGRARACADLVFSFASSRSWLSMRNEVFRLFGHNDFTNSVTNLGIVLVALLAGEGNMEKTIDICYRSGYDTDCTCATAAAFLGILHGASAIPQKLKDLVGDTFVCGINIRNSNRSIRKLAEEVYAFSQNPKEGVRPESVITVSYKGDPVIGPGLDCSVCINVENRLPYVRKGMLCLSEIPKDWICTWSAKEISVNPGCSVTVENVLSLSSGIRMLREKNLLALQWEDEKTTFGVVGASVWRVRGAYFEALDKPLALGIPSPHGEGSVLPSPECMVNNIAFLDKPYGNANDPAILMVSPTNMIAIETAFPWFVGQGLWYAKTTVRSPEERDVWMVVGNNDGFSVSLNGKVVLKEDAIRLWTPYNNAAIVHLREGANQLELTLLRRTEHLRFSLDWRYYEGEHYHRKPYLTDLSCEW
ncbi:MAG: ADP-ribosylglycohydrolase family protein [Sphaerochaetaceae bacterium]